MAVDSDCAKRPLNLPGRITGEPQENTILCVSFNRDFGCFACGIEQGSHVYNSDTLTETFKRDFLNDGCPAMEMLFRSNIMALVGGKYPPSKVMIWDDNHKRDIGEMSFRTEVRAIRLRKDQIVVVLDTKICVDFKLLNQYNIIANPGDRVQLLTLWTISSLPALDCPRGRSGLSIMPRRGLSLSMSMTPRLLALPYS